MDIFIERTKATKNLVFKGTVKALLKKLALNSGTVLVIRNNVLLTEADMLKDTDTIKILSVISGG